MTASASAGSAGEIAGRVLGSRARTRRLGTTDAAARGLSRAFGDRDRIVGDERDGLDIVTRPACRTDGSGRRRVGLGLGLHPDIAMLRA